MCGIATNTKPSKQLEQRFAAKQAPLALPSFKIVKAFANDTMPIITQENQTQINYFEWGLLPQWARGDEMVKKIREQTINARSETIFEKPSFKTSILHQRCLVLCDGFIEYQHIGKHKQAYFVQLKNEQAFAMAGIYSIWHDAQTNISKNTFSIVTVPANELMSIIHNSKKRMPLILPANTERQWIEANHPSDIKQMFLPFPSDYMKAHTIDNQIGKKKCNQNDINLLQRKEIITQTSLF
jgi:putative SOS response-associated peptidase YedK